MKPSFSLPQSSFVVEMQHKHAVGEIVRITVPFTTHGKVYTGNGVIHAILPYTFISPAYYVKFGSDVIALSERSIERIDDGSTK